MDFEVYCDESGLEALVNKDAHRFIGIGGIWLPAEKRDDMKSQLHSIKTHFKIYGEFKWNKLSPKYLPFFKSIIDYFFLADYLRFRIVIIDSDKVDNYTFNQGDTELGFYKFYYQLLHHWILDFNEYDIFLDFKLNRNKGRLIELCRILNNANLTSIIKQVQGLPSDQSLGIQLADLLTGLVTAKFNEEISSTAKIGLIKHVEDNYLKHKIVPTAKHAEKVNIFHINLQGGW